MNETQRLEQFAHATQQKIYSGQSDLDPKDKPMVEMHAWCSKQGDIVAMNSNLILSCNPTSRSVQNCKVVMRNKGLTPGHVVPATSELIRMLLANTYATTTTQGESAESVSEQQQRLRILVREALQAQASDIHIEVRQETARIRFRKHGELYLHAEWIPKLGRELASVAFNKETDHSVSHFNPMIPQSASMSLRIDNRDVRLRLASMPAHSGFDVVMRVLTVGDDEISSLSELGYDQQQIDLLQKAIHMPHGAILIAGPTGSGKTTTVASCLEMIEDYRKVYTIEEPVEKIIPNASQVPINTEHDDRSFASMGRASLRMDPDVIALGEMRDEETARVMTRAAITGHLVFSTLHTNTATAIVTRLVDMGISPAMLGDSNVLVCLICQRLAPVLCDQCAMPLVGSEIHKPHLSRWEQVFDVFGDIRIRGEGCEMCFNTGLAGRTVVAEIIWVDDDGRRFIHQGDTLGWERYLKQQSWQNQKDHGIQLVRSGRCDPLDMERIVGEISDISTEQYSYG